MPIYEYECKQCGHEFEVWQKISERPKRKCENCGKQSAERVISRTGFQLKGGGWYSDGYGSGQKGAKKSAGEAKDAKKADAGKKSGESPSSKAASSKD